MSTEHHYPDTVPDHGWPSLLARRVDGVEGMQRGIVDELMRQRALLEEVVRGQRETHGLIGGLLAADSQRARQDTLHDEQLKKHDRLLTARSVGIALAAAFGGGIAQVLWNLARGH